jgi:hypothetical protein
MDAVLQYESLTGCGKTPCSPFDKPDLSGVEGLRANGGSAEN